MNNQQILTAIRQGNSSDFMEELYLYFPTIKSFVLKMSGDEEEAKDVFQEALIIFFEKAQDPNFELSSQATTYVYAIAKNLWFSRLREKGKKISSQTEYITEEEADIETYLEEERKYGYLDQIINQLSEKCQAIFKQFYFLKRSMIEIAHDLNISSENAAKTQKYKCIERAKKLAAKLENNVEPQNHQS